jgi:hypothetical protein
MVPLKLIQVTEETGLIVPFEERAFYFSKPLGGEAARKFVGANPA